MVVFFNSQMGNVMVVSFSSHVGKHHVGVLQFSDGEMLWWCPLIFRLGNIMAVSFKFLMGKCHDGVL